MSSRKLSGLSGVKVTLLVALVESIYVPSLFITGKTSAMALRSGVIMAAMLLLGMGMLVVPYVPGITSWTGLPLFLKPGKFPASSAELGVVVTKGDSCCRSRFAYS